MSNRPARQLCPLCGRDDDVTLVHVDGLWVMSCADRQHLPFEWRPKEQHARPGSYRTGIGEELGVYDDLLACVHGGLAEYGVIEQRFSVQAPRTYRHLVDRYGHTAQGPSRYTASAFLGGALGALWREGSVDGVWGPATGYWSYNGQVGAYAPTGTAEDGPILSWVEHAVRLGCAPGDWPPLGYVAPPPA